MMTAKRWETVDGGGYKGSLARPKQNRCGRGGQVCVSPVGLVETPPGDFVERVEN